jgi:hypothetical protein
VDNLVAKARMLVPYDNAACFAHTEGDETEMTVARGEPGTKQAART